MPLIASFLRWVFGWREPESLGESPSLPLQPRQAPLAKTDPLPEPSSACWRRIIRGEAQVSTANVPLQFLLKNNLRCVRRAQDSEQVIAERIRMTRNFFLKNGQLLGDEIRFLRQIEGEATR